MEVARNAGTQLTGDEAGLMAYYRLNAVSGSVALDSRQATAADTTLHPGTLYNFALSGTTSNWVNAAASGLSLYAPYIDASRSAVVDASNGATSATLVYGVGGGSGAALTLVAPTGPSTGAYTWSSSNPAVVAVDASSGVVTVVGAGSATIYATQALAGYYSGGAVAFSVVVAQGTPVVGSITGPAVGVVQRLGVDASFALVAPTTNSGGAVSWSSSNTAVATVDASSGVVSVVGVGSAQITASVAATGNYVAGATTTVVRVSGPGADLSGVSMVGLDLSGSALTGARMPGADLSGANLTASDLSGAVLSGANLTGATLTRANLSGADLSGATLSGVVSGGITGTPSALPTGYVLVSGLGPAAGVAGGVIVGPGVNLAGVELSGVNLAGLDLSGVNLAGARLVNCDLSGVNLTGANLNGIVSSGNTGTPVLSVGFVISNGVIEPQNSAAFDGINDYVDAGVFTSPAAITVEAWVYLRSVAAGTYDVVVSKWTDSFELAVVGGVPQFSVYNGTSTATAVAASSITAGAWHHLAAVFDGSGVAGDAGAGARIYVDGTIAGRAALTGSLHNSVARLTIGASQNGSTRFFDGVMDEVRIWSAARTPEEIVGTMTNQLTGNETGLMAYYKFNQGVAGGNNAGITVLYDLTPHARNALFYNFAMTGTTSNLVAAVPASLSPVVLRAPTFGAFYTAGVSKTFGLAADASFTLVAPTSDSSGAFVWDSSNAAVATVSGMWCPLSALAPPSLP